MHRPLPIQLAIQGGGAKLINLIAASEPFSYMHSRRQIKITRVAGTSAGSIIATILAAGISPAAVNAFIREKGSSYVENIRCALTPFGLKGVNCGKSMRDAVIAWRCYRGNPVIPPEILRRFLEDLLKEGLKRVPHTIGELEKASGIKLIITSSDLGRSKGVEFGSDANLIDSILSSCSVPLVFRSFRDLQVNRYVDGGLCENLPAEILERDRDRFGEVFAISPDSPGDDLNHKNLLSYLACLFSASMNHHVERNRELVGSFRTISFRNTLDTFDFDKVVENTDRTQSYADIKKVAETKIIDYLNLVRNNDLQSGKIFSGAVDVSYLANSLDRILNSFRPQQSQDGPEISECTTIVFANCLKLKSEAAVAEPDRLISRYVFKARTENVRILETVIRFSAGDMLHWAPTMWSVHNKTTARNEKAELIPIPGVPGSRESKAMLFLYEPIKPDDGLFEFTCNYVVRDAMANIDKEGFDFIAENNMNDHDIPVMHLICMVPKTFNAKVKPFRAPSSTMDFKELDATEARRLVPAGETDYIPVAVCFRDVKPGARCAVDFTRVGK